MNCCTSDVMKLCIATCQLEFCHEQLYLTALEVCVTELPLHAVADHVPLLNRLGLEKFATLQMYSQEV